MDAALIGAQVLPEGSFSSYRECILVVRVVAGGGGEFAGIAEGAEE